MTLSVIVPITITLFVPLFIILTHARKAAKKRISDNIKIARKIHDEIPGEIPGEIPKDFATDSPTDSPTDSFTDSFTDTNPDHDFPVRYAGKNHYTKIWKLFPWEEHGLLCVREKTLIFYSADHNPLPIPLEKVTLTWIGVSYWPNGILSWFAVNDGINKHYFTSDTGIWGTRSFDTTKAIYDWIKDIMSTRQLHDT